jgi:hypothetical protein
MTLRNKILLGLLVPAIGIFVAVITWPDTTLEYMCYIYSIAVMIVNMWEWFEPEVNEELFGMG